jgi:predicted outer membrane protein
MWMIRVGGYHTNKQGDKLGLGLKEHLMRARTLIWPERYRHRWTDLMYDNFIANDVTILMGCASSQKTSHASEYCLLNYWASPDNTLVVLSTVNNEKLDVGIWAEVKMLWSRGHERFPWLAGNVIEYKRSITTESLEEEGTRDFRKGIICRPCYVGGRWVGLGILAGLKQNRIFYVADELQFMQEAFSASWPHLFSNGQVKIIGSGNPKHDPDDELAKTAEPPGGWNSMPEPEKTEVWATKFMGGKCLNLVGTDSPNFEVGDDDPIPFPGLINRQFAKRMAHDHGEGSFEYYRLVKGVMKVAFTHSRVITRQLCREHRALESVTWKNDQQTMIYALDPSYGGEDRCVGMPLRFGEDIDGQIMLELMPYYVFRLDLRKDMSVEDQIAQELERQLTIYHVEPENCFYDSCGKGTIGAALARLFGARVPVAVDSGARPSKRPVREDLFVEENGQKRLKRCEEHYSKFVSEMWFSVRYTIEAEQLRGLLEDVMSEGCARVYEMVGGNKLEVEPKTDPKKKEDLRRRLGKSPDLFDTAAIGVEVARQRGFRIARLGAGNEDNGDGFEWLAERVRKHNELISSKKLNYA